MNWYEFLLFVHVLGAFAVGAASAWFWVLTLTSWRAERASTVLTLGRLVQPATIVVGFGIVVTLIFGLWLTFYVDGYELWDFWILASIVLWAVATETGRRGGVYHQKDIPPLQELAQSGRDEITPEFRTTFPNRTAIMFDAISTVAVFLILILMIFKPGV